MSDVMRWRYGETNPVVAPVAAEVAIEIGDLVFLDTDQVLPASAIDDVGGEGPETLAAAQELFHDGFLGVAMQASSAGDAGNIRVATSGVFEFDCEAATFELGTRIGIDLGTGGTTLAPQRAVAVAAGSPQLAIGRVARRQSSAATRVLVEIHSTVMRDGPQAVA